MHLLNFLSDIYPSTPDKIQAWASIGALISTVIMVVYAKKALYTWKQQKIFEIEVELLSKIGEAMVLLNKLNKTYFAYDELMDYQKKIQDQVKAHDNNHFYDVSSLNSGFMNHFDSIERDIVDIRQCAMKAKQLSNNESIKTFYNIWLFYESEIFATILNYTTIFLNHYGDMFSMPQIKIPFSTLPHPNYDALIEAGVEPINAISGLFNNLPNIHNEPNYLSLRKIYSDLYFDYNGASFKDYKSKP